MVFRWAFYSFARSMNDLILPSISPGEISEDTLSTDIIRRLSGDHGVNVLHIDKTSAPMVWNLPDYPSNGSFDLNIVVVGGKTVLIGAGAGEAQEVAAKGGTFGVFALEYHSLKDLSLICHFRGGIRLK